MHIENILTWGNCLSLNISSEDPPSINNQNKNYSQFRETFVTLKSWSPKIWCWNSEWISLAEGCESLQSSQLTSHFSCSSIHQQQQQQQQLHLCNQQLHWGLVRTGSRAKWTQTSALCEQECSVNVPHSGSHSFSSIGGWAGLYHLICWWGRRTLEEQTANPVLLLDSESLMDLWYKAGSADQYNPTLSRWGNVSDKGSKNSCRQD